MQMEEKKHKTKNRNFRFLWTPDIFHFTLKRDEELFRNFMMVPLMANFFSWSAKIDGTKHSLNFTTKCKATVESVVDFQSVLACCLCRHFELPTSLR